ncbi:NfeD family protein [Psychromonas sp. 14N.309.X.WAT.B.A12]|jgi:inner membrane protein|uniref:NfeD family protein n=1 Tax=unclassified Psychromonas TaxID=2614957 RepID=UPI0025B07EBE|nr:NfeD family protein [Psychromonas sp. 14N.309.X.WAT.B.A12]MDN2663154.1 NfeD family protein [Psychromonas sp. 14N.309.X.WAT.B.A12]
MEYLLAHLPQTLVVLGLIFLVIEVLVLGFSTFVLLFVGIGTIVTGLLMALGFLPETLVNALLATAVLSSLVALVSWQPMKRMQNKVESHQVDNGMVGETFTLEEDLLVGKTVNHRYSGIDWQVKSKQALSAGTEVKIVNMQVGVLTVESV